MKKIIIPLRLLESACGVHINKQEEPIRPIIENAESYHAYDYVVLQEKSIIPELIPFISDTSIVYVPCIHPWNSNRPNILSATSNNRRGICFARLIDYYLSYTPEKEKEYQAHKDITPYNGQMKGRFFIHPLYEFGIIVKIDNAG